MLGMAQKLRMSLNGCSSTSVQNAGIFVFCEVVSNKDNRRCVTGTVLGQ